MCFYFSFVMKNSTKKITLGSVVTGVVATHQTICPLHGLIPNTLYLISGASAATSFLNETQVGQLGTTIHDWSVEKMASGLSHFYDQPYEQQSEGIEVIHGYALSGTLEEHLEEGHTHHLEGHVGHEHHGHYSPEVYHAAEIGVTGLNLALLSIGVYSLYKGIRAKRREKLCEGHR